MPWLTSLRMAVSLMQRSRMFPAFYSLTCLLILLTPTLGQARDINTGLRHISLDTLPGNGPISALQAPYSFHSYLDQDDRTVGEIRKLPDSHWIRSKRKDINHGYTSAVLWIRIQLNNNTRAPMKILLEEDFTLIRSIDALVFSPEEAQPVDQARIDRTLKFAKRPIPFSNPVMPLIIPPGKHTVYVRLSSDMDMIAALQIWDPRSFQRDAESRLLIFGILYGSVLLMALYNGLIWLSLRDRSYFLYSLYSLAFLFYFLSYYGHGAQFLWGSFPWFEQRAVPIVMALQIGLFGSEFFRLFLNITRNQKYQYWCLRGIQIFSAGLLAASLTMPPARVIVIYPLYAISGILIIAVISVVRYRQGYQPALFSIFAFLILWVTGIGSSLRSLGLVPYNNITMYGVAFGNVAELLLLSFGLGYRLRKLEDETETTGKRNQSLTSLLQGLPYAILLRQAGDLLFANRAAHTLYKDMELPNWKESGIYAFRQNQRDRWISVHAADILMEGRSARLQFHSEITEEMESKLALEEKHASTLDAKMQSEENRRAQDEFLSSMTAEIRKPMSAVYLASDVINQLELDSDQKDLSGILLRSAATLVSLLNDLEEVSRLESGTLNIHMESVDLSGLLKDTVELFRTSAQRKGLTLKLDLNPLPAALELDKTRLQQVMSNLISNAIKFSDPGLIEIRGRYERGSLEISVEDNGPGIPPEKMHRLFRKFEQLDPGTYRRFGGTGLGLAISKGILEQLNGEIGCDNRKEGGSRFWIRLPAKKLEGPGPSDGDSTATSVQGMRAGLSIVQDDAAEMLEAQLRLLGINVIRLDGTEASWQRAELDFLITENWQDPSPWPSILWNADARNPGHCPWPILTPPCSSQELARIIRDLMAGKEDLSA